ncbi:hypothetical protein ATER59S_00985 [Aquamicrobium terrae]
MEEFTALLLSNEWVLMGVVFLATVSIVFFVILFLRPAYRSDRAIQRKLTSEKVERTRQEKNRQPNRVNLYYETVQNRQQDSLEQKLQQAGFYGKQAASYYYAIKYGLIGAAFVLCFVLLAALTSLPPVAEFGFAVLASCLFLVLPGIYLSRRAKRNQVAYRRSFPDFMDMMIVCADAGLSLEAAANRVARDLGVSSPELGLHLEVMNLEMRAGRPMREALHNLARRTGLPEARTLAILFQQSEELGTSMIQALRVYSDEMRTRRMVIAEERANALPVKMLAPLGACVFPVILIVVMLPIVARVIKVMPR